ncbi:SubName: Full=Uncharacterized protein {ECO:0000313/EMBL:CCA75892.1} [Serendipita indica DSM 11827]|nr:SubName: Full=Uncharacterized protein {ECO:0000313/EMBL:CCA75892.1} [Serendipita indica DSM 11827]
MARAFHVSTSTFATLPPFFSDGRHVRTQRLLCYTATSSPPPNSLRRGPRLGYNSDILFSPNLTRLSYVVVGQSRLSDGKRAAALALWELPKLQHLDIQPVGSTCDWSLVTDGLRGIRVENTLL